MEYEQVLKRVEWLDEERRKDRNALVQLDDRLKNLEGNIQNLLQQIKEINGEVVRVKMAIPRLDNIDEGLIKQKKETKKMIDNLEKELQRRTDEIEKVRRIEMNTLDTGLTELRKEVSTLGEIKRALQTRADEDIRLQRSIDEIRDRFETTKRNEEETNRLFRLMEDGRRQDTKRITDAQGELAALRKRLDEVRSQIEINTTTLRKQETRIAEAESSDLERRKAQNRFLEEQALLQVERDKVWKEWVSRFDTIEKQTVDIEATLETLDTTNRAVVRTQQITEELSQKVERRLNEITEIQRLAEERFRQEWVTYKADDQKRWTNYTLIQEEQRDEIARYSEKLVDRITMLEDTSQDIRDLVQIINEHTEKRLQSLLAVVHDWVGTYERSMGKSRT